jgi:hypothetical protein
MFQLTDKKHIYFCALVATISLWSAIARAQTSQQSLSTSQDNSYVLDHVLLGMRSYNDTTQVRLMQNPTNQSLLGTQEFYAGWKFESGWSLSAMVVQTYSVNNSQAAQPGLQWEVSDPSITIGHPELYHEGGLKIIGQFREYFAMSPYFLNHHISEFAYYSLLEYKFAGGSKLFNALIPRYYYEPEYIAGDTTTYLEDATNWSRKLNRSFSMGVGQWTQVENHSTNTTGYCSEVYPFVEYKWSDKVTISPRVLFPILTSGSVYQGPTAVSLDNVRANIFFQAAL